MLKDVKSITCFWVQISKEVTRRVLFFGKANFLVVYVNLFKCTVTMTPMTQKTIVPILNHDAIYQFQLILIYPYDNEKLTARYEVL